MDSAGQQAVGAAAPAPEARRQPTAASSPAPELYREFSIGVALTSALDELVRALSELSVLPPTPSANALLCFCCSPGGRGAYQSRHSLDDPVAGESAGGWSCAHAVGCPDVARPRALPLCSSTGS
jgi:hypothetical protein